MLGIKRITGAAGLAPEGGPGSWVSDAAQERFMAAYERGSLIPQAQVAVVPGSHGGFSRAGELNDRIAAFINGRATGGQAARPAPRSATGRQTS